MSRRRSGRRAPPPPTQTGPRPQRQIPEAEPAPRPLGDRLRTTTAPAAALLPVRFFFGVTFLYAGIDKLLDPTFFDASSPTSIHAQLLGFARGSPIGDLVRLGAPEADAIGLLIAIAEVGIGLGALSGLAFRIAAAGGAALSFLFFLTVSWTTHPYYLGSDLPYAVGWLALAIAGHGGLLVPRRLTGRAREPARRSGDGLAIPRSPSPSRRALLQTGLLAVAALAVSSLAVPVRMLGLERRSRRREAPPARAATPSAAPRPGSRSRPSPTSTESALPRSPCRSPRRRRSRPAIRASSCGCRTARMSPSMPSVPTLDARSGAAHPTRPWSARVTARPSIRRMVPRSWPARRTSRWPPCRSSSTHRPARSCCGPDRAWDVARRRTLRPAASNERRLDGATAPDHQSTMMPNGATPPGMATGDEASSLRLPRSTAKTLTARAPASTTYRKRPDGSSRASNGRRPVGLLNGVLPSSDRLPLGCDGVARDRGARGVDREQIPAVVRDLDPARGRLLVGERRSTDRGQAGVVADVVGGDAPRQGAVVGVRNEQLVRVGRPEGAPERSDPLGRERRAGGGGESAVTADPEAVDEGWSCGGTDSCRGQGLAVPADQDLARQGVVR